MSSVAIHSFLLFLITSVCSGSSNFGSSNGSSSISSSSSLISNQESLVSSPEGSNDLTDVEDPGLDFDEAEVKREKYQKNFVRYLRYTKSTKWKNLCGKWDDWCSPGSKIPAMQCCDRLHCRCNLWNTHCKCKSSLFSRRWT